MPRFTFLLLFLLGMLGFGPTAMAGAPDKTLGLKLAQTDDVAFAYYRMTNLPLDIDALITSDPAYTALDPVKQRETYVALRPDLQNRYNQYSPLTTPLVVRTPIELTVIDKPAALKIGYKNNELPYFPYSILGKTISLYPEDLTNYAFLPLGDDLDIRRAKALAQNKPQLLLELVPSLASKTAVKISGIPQYPILCKIARLRILTGDGMLIYGYANPKFDHLYNSEIRSLFAGTQNNAPVPVPPPQK